MKKIRIFKIICLVIAIISEVILFMPQTADLGFLGNMDYCLFDYDIGLITGLMVVPYIVFECISFSEKGFEKKTYTILAKSFMLAFALLMLLTGLHEEGNFNSSIGALAFIMSVILFIFAGVSFGLDLKYLKIKQNK